MYLRPGVARTDVPRVDRPTLCLKEDGIGRFHNACCGAWGRRSLHLDSFLFPKS